MPKVKLESGTIHEVPLDLENTLTSSSQLVEIWNNLTPLARNEWICRVTSPKKDETRVKRIALGKVQLLEGKKRPCCWPGCPHHRESAKKWFK
jgi:uncharacterized protein YdeI (YjbR/CyaY-like superfamily)